MNANQMQVIPAVALRGAAILPGMIVHFDMARTRSINAVERAMMGDQRLFLVSQRDPGKENPGLKDVYSIGIISRIRQVVKLPKGMIRVLVEGVERAELSAFEDEGMMLVAEIFTFDENTDVEPDEMTKEAMRDTLVDLFKDYSEFNAAIGKEVAAQIMEIKDLRQMLREIAINMALSWEASQDFIEAVTLEEQYDSLSTILAHETQIMKVREEIQEKLRSRLDKNQREYVLREQLKIIREELGDDTTMSDIDKFKEEAKNLKCSQEIREKILTEIGRFEKMQQSSAEGTVLRGYIETMLSLPWDKVSRDRKDLKRAKEILDRDHYGLDKVKERILEFLAVRQLTKKGVSPILCLVGPPGTGKTSIGRSIAEALGKKYVRISLGGVRDEAEIRGHRRTYVGAMPGRIVSSLKKAGVKNPLMVLDEIDKLSSDYKGDTASAMLEVLDSEQNSHFEDHYVEMPVDLSEVLFVATANDLQTIPRPLLDRMELIEISSYTENEKQHIAREHLLPKQMEKNGIKPDMLAISNGALDDIIVKYTREAGVRQLEREIGEICRKTARKVLEEHASKVTVTEKNLARFLGTEKYTVDPANVKDEVGIARGLAWTAVGGVTLQIEVNVMPGNGDFMLTGQLGDVMKESAQAGISYIRSAAQEYGIDKEFYKKYDIHIHIPEGAVPKDGPSAGITMATAMFSALTRTPVRANVAMTGEITLRGRVLPIGGLKEKLLAARKAGITKVLVPGKNKRDYKEIAREITRDLDVCFVDDMSDVLREALVKNEEN